MMNPQKAFADFLIHNRHHFTLGLLLVLAGCSLIGAEDSSRVRLSIQGNTDVLRRVISVDLRAPGWHKELSGSDFQTPEAPTYTQAFETPQSGELSMETVLKDSAGNHMTSGSVLLDIRTDWIWEIDIVLDDHNPFNGCFGCVGARSFPLDSVFKSAPEDSLFILWGGNSIKHPVIY